jgi:energy-coupling factor transporter ATP-binding protein EcfA2
MPTIKGLHVENFGCVKDVSVPLTPLHAFIGPNDSGKSTLLRALQFPAFVAGGGKETSPYAGQTTRIRIAFDDGGAIDLRWKPNTGWDTAGEASTAMDRAMLLRLDPDELRTASRVILEGQPLRYNERGLGVASVYDALTSRNFSALSAIRDKVRDLFPTVEEIGFPAATAETRTVRLKLRDGAVVAAKGASEGLLYFLALAALPFLDAGACVMLEEPENGLHPARIAEVVKVLREVSRSTQVILATHSPLVINELEPDEVSVVTRDPVAGTQVVPIANTPDFEERSKVYQLGELWLAYSDGEAERPLLEGRPRL